MAIVYGITKSWLQLIQLTYDHSGNSNQYPVPSPFWLLRTQLFPDLDKFQGTVHPTAVLPLATRTSRPCIHKSVFSKGSRGPTPDPDAASLCTPAAAGHPGPSGPTSGCGWAGGLVTNG